MKNRRNDGGGQLLGPTDMAGEMTRKLDVSNFCCPATSTSLTLYALSSVRMAQSSCSSSCALAATS